MDDLIGDIHGHADALERLLASLGYSRQQGVWASSSGLAEGELGMPPKLVKDLPTDLPKEPLAKLLHPIGGGTAGPDYRANSDPGETRGTVTV